MVFINECTHMKIAPLPKDETRRLAALRDYQILDTLPEAAYDDITRIAAHICGTSIALVSLVDEDRQWFKSRFGLDAEQTPRDVAFCAHAILEPEKLFVVDDARADTRFADNPLVASDPKIRFYAGAPLVAASGHALGTLCVIDRQPHRLDSAQADTLKALARQVEAQLELRLSLRRERTVRAKLEHSFARLTEKNAELESVYHTVSHELKTPLCAAREFVALVLDGIGGSLTPDQDKHLRTAVECCDRLTFLLDNWMETVRSETGKLELERRPTNIDQLVTKMVESCNVLAQKKGISLESQPNAPSVIVDVDARRIEQTVTNLLTNAVKFTEPGGRVRARTGADAKRVFIEISDNGRGIQAAHHEHIFSPFFQAEAADTSARQGMGLGLHVCRSIVEKHGGQLTLESQPGAGSTFTVSLPTEQCSSS